MKKKVGRPPKFTKKQIGELLEEFERYIEETEIPVVAEFASKNGFGKQYIYDREEFSYLIKVAITKKEANLEIKALRGEINVTMAIFALKQIGWKDKQEVEQTGEQIIYITDRADKPANAGMG